MGKVILKKIQNLPQVSNVTNEYLDTFINQILHEIITISCLIHGRY